MVAGRYTLLQYSGKQAHFTGFELSLEGQRIDKAAASVQLEHTLVYLTQNRGGKPRRRQLFFHAVYQLLVGEQQTEHVFLGLRAFHIGIGERPVLRLRKADRRADLAPLCGAAPFAAVYLTRGGEIRGCDQCLLSLPPEEGGIAWPDPWAEEVRELEHQ